MRPDERKGEWIADSFWIEQGNAEWNFERGEIEVDIAYGSGYMSVQERAFLDLSDPALLKEVIKALTPDPGEDRVEVVAEWLLSILPKPPRPLTVYQAATEARIVHARKLARELLALLDPAPTDQRGKPCETCGFYHGGAPSLPSQNLPADQGAEGSGGQMTGAEFRDALKDAGYKIVPDTETTEGLVRVELTREEADELWADLGAAAPVNAETHPVCARAWDKLRGALATEGEGER